jgi:hypothetical protein
MKSFLYGLLGVSLVGNVALLALTRSAAPDASAARAFTASRSETNSAHPDSAADAAPVSSPSSIITTPMRWAPVTDMESLHATVAAMRAAGFPARTTWAVADRLFNEQLDAQSPYRALAYWQPPTAAQRQAAKDASLEHLRVRTELRAAIGRPSDLLDPLDRERLYGNLPDEKVDALYSLSEDYEKIQATLRAGPGVAPTASGMNDPFRQMAALKNEQQSDVANLLTAEELEIYQMHQSDSARRVATNVREVSVSEEEFAALYQLDKRFVGDDLRVGDIRARELQQKRQADQPEYYAQLQAALGEERFYPYLTGLDSNYRSITQLADKYPTLTPRVSYQVLQLAADVHQQLEALQRNGSRADLQAAFVTIHARLEALVGRDAALALRQSAAGGILQGPPPSAAPASAVPPRN